MARAARPDTSRLGWCLWVALIALLFSGCVQEPAGRSKAPRTADTTARRSSPGRHWTETRYRPFQAPTAEKQSPARLGSEAPSLVRAARRVDRLRSEVFDSGATQRLANDLAASYLARASSTPPHPSDSSGMLALDLIEAAAWARRAIRLEPEAPAPRFNYATALSGLSLHRAAEVAWRTYLERDQQSEWAAEAHAMLRGLRASQERAGRFADLTRLSLRSSRSEIVGVARDFPYQARLHVETVDLPNWLDEPDQTKPHELQRVARTVARELARSHGTHLLADQIRLLDGAGEDQRRRLVEAHRSYADGLTHYEAKRYARALEHLEKACKTFDLMRAPFRFACAVQLAIAVQTRDPRAALEMLRELAAEVPERYPTVRGRLHWMLGSAGIAREEWSEVLPHLEAAARELGRSAGRWRAAGAHALLGEALTRYGDMDAAWRHNLEALRATTDRPGPRRRHGVLFGIVDAMIRSRRVEQALPFCDELVLSAEAWGDDGARAEAYSRRAWIWMELGDRERSERDLGEALEASSRLPGHRLASRSTRFVEALVGSRFGRWPDLDTLTAAYEEYSRDGLDYERLPFLVARARLHEAAGDLEAGLEALLEASATHEARGGEFHPTGPRLLARSQAENVHRDLVRVAVELGRLEEALDLADRSRWLPRGSEIPPPDGRKPLVAQLSEAFDPGTVLLDYTVLDDRTVALVVEIGDFRNAKIRAVEIGGGDARITRLVHLHSRALERGDARARTLAAEIHALLIEPLELPAQLRRLVVVPDRMLWHLQFGALVDDASGSYLVERAPISTALGLRQAATSARRRQRLDPGVPPSVLVVGAPDLAETPWRHWPPLAAAAEEAATVAGLYPRSTVIAHEAASKSAILESLAGRELFHFAGHADIDSERREGARLLVARGGSNGADSLALTAWDLLGRDWSSLELAFLSVCRSLQGYQVGRAGLVGLGSTFVAGGARAAVVSLWDVDDDLASDFAIRFHRSYRELRDPALALRAVALHDLSQPTASTSAWTPFVVLGI